MSEAPGQVGFFSPCSSLVGAGFLYIRVHSERVANPPFQSFLPRVFLNLLSPRFI